MVKSFAPLAASAALLVAAATAASVPDGTWPTSTGTVQYSEAYTVKAGEVFDGKMQTFERSDISCEGQTESGSSTAVFLVEAGGTLKNAIIGKNQMEGVHCDDSDCTIDNVWWDDVCEDALSIKGGTAICREEPRLDTSGQRGRSNERGTGPTAARWLQVPLMTGAVPIHRQVVQRRKAIRPRPELSWAPRLHKSQ